MRGMVGKKGRDGERERGIRLVIFKNVKVGGRDVLTILWTCVKGGLSEPVGICLRGRGYF